jgi:hypothetical protein
MSVEAHLYGPVKAFLESLGYEVKGEIGRCDLVGLRAGEPDIVVVGELKLSFSFDLVLQGVDRMRVGDEVWLAARLAKRGRGREGDRRFRDLCRHLGFGLLGVASTGRVEVILPAAAPLPRRDLKRRSRLVEEHRRRRGDPAVGGGTRVPVMTAYRQQALACAAAMAAGPQRPRDLKPAIPDAQKILRHNVYGWFERRARGIYGLTEAGAAALERWPQAAE